MPSLAEYDPSKDETLTEKQISNGYFSEAVSSGHGDVRARPSLTIGGIYSGYHESYLSTEAMLLLHLSEKVSKGFELIKLAGAKDKKSPWAGYEGKTFPRENMEKLFKSADGFRIDTARMIMTAQYGMGAGHTNSGMSQKNQQEAHKLVSRSVIRSLFTNEKGVTEISMAALAVAVSVASVAPGELARTVPGTLKDPYAPFTWEIDRNEAKSRLDLIMSQLSETEKDFVIKHVQDYFNDVQGENSILLPTSYLTNDKYPIVLPASQYKSRLAKTLKENPGLHTLNPQEYIAKRVLEKGRARSPKREVGIPGYFKAGTIRGGTYVGDNVNTVSASSSLPRNIADIGKYGTQPFRAIRRF